MAAVKVLSEELYPIGTDIVTKYIGRDSEGRGNFTEGKNIDSKTGEYVDYDNAASDVYIPISPYYTYQKSGWRLYNGTWYDENYDRISRFSLNNLQVQLLPKAPENARYFRFATHPTAKSNWRITITRIPVTSHSLQEARRRILLNTPHLTTLSANPLTFKTDISAPIKGGKIYFEPVQEGTGDPSPDNVRPISGWDGVTVYKTGKNLFANQNGARCYVGMKAGVTYAVSYNASSNAYFRGYDVNGEYVTGIIWMNVGIVNGRRYGTITPSIDIPYGSIYVGSGVSEAQIEVGSSPTDYEPYTGTSITIPFPQTIYGGYVDLVRGEVVETDYLLAVDENTVPYNVRRNTGGRVVGYYNLPYAGIKDAFTYYSHGQCIKSTTATYNYQVAGCAANEPYNSDAVRAAISASSDITTVEQYSNWIASVAPLQIAYKLATPITYQLTPETIRTLRGVNNVWSNANGNIEIDYWGH